MDFSAVMNLVLGGGLVATINSHHHPEINGQGSEGESGEGYRRSRDGTIDNTEHATRILIENIVEPLKEELNEKQESFAGDPA
ncbi:hypothetical protein INE74_01613 [Bacteroides ovatus CL03T12C18]|nr:hypothetical protein [Bacteroides ovatus CL03T12C18]